MLVYPDFDPVAVHLGPVAIHWYGLMYLLGFAGGWWLGTKRAQQPHIAWPRERVGDRIWEGGMSFHGGLIGVIVAMLLLARRLGLRPFDISDFAAPLIPFGLFTGRIGNFINGELWGKPTDLPWGMVFPHAGPLPRHPSMLYEAGLEGLAMLAILWWFGRKPRPRMAVTGLFLVLYGVFRIAVEFVRLPDAHIGYLFGTAWITEGQVLSLPVLLAGLIMLALAYTRGRHEAPA